MNGTGKFIPNLIFGIPAIISTFTYGGYFFGQNIVWKSEVKAERQEMHEKLSSKIDTVKEEIKVVKEEINVVTKKIGLSEQAVTQKLASVQSRIEQVKEDVKVATNKIDLVAKGTNIRLEKLEKEFK